MIVMSHPSLTERQATSRNRRSHLGAGLYAMSQPVWAETGAQVSTGPWIFATAALVLIAWLAWRSGRQASQAPRDLSSPDRQGQPDTSRTIDALLSSVDGQTRICRRAPNGRDWLLLAANPPLPAGASALDSVPAAVAFAARSLNAGTSAESYVARRAKALASATWGFGLASPRTTVFHAEGDVRPTRLRALKAA